MHPRRNCAFCQGTKTAVVAAQGGNSLNHASRVTSSRPFHPAGQSPQASSHHLFSSLTCASSSCARPAQWQRAGVRVAAHASQARTGVKSFLMLKTFLISSGVLPFIMVATLAQVRSRSGLMSR